MKKIITSLLVGIFLQLSFLSHAQCNLNVLYAFSPTCGTSNNGGITVTSTGTIGTVNYSINPSGITNNNGSFIGLGPGTYTISATDSFSCSASTTVTLNNPIPVTITGIQSHPCSYFNAEVNLTGGSGNYTLSTVPVSTTNLSSAHLTSIGMYTITIVDAAGCTATTTYNFVPSTPIPIVSTPVTNSSCILINGTGEMCANTTGGIPPYSVNIQNGFINLTNTTGCFNNLDFGTYALTTTDMQGCTDTAFFEISNSNPNSFSYNNTNPSSCSSTDGEICITNVLSATLPVTYSLNGGTPQTTPCFSNLANSNYTISVTDANNCTGTELVALFTNPITGSMSYTLPSCGASNGSICVNAVSGGLPPYVYSLNGGTYQASSCFNSLGAASHTITIKDALNCSNDLITNLNNPNFLDWPNTTYQTCSTLGTVTATVSALAALPVTYTLLPLGLSNTTGSFTNLLAGNYTVSAMDAGGCISQKPAYINSNFNFGAMPTAITGPGSLTIIAPPGMVPPLQYSANYGPLQSSNTYTGLCSSYITFTVVDANGCFSNGGATVTSMTTFPGHTITANIVEATCPNFNNGEIMINISPAGSFTYCHNGNPNILCGITSPLFTNLLYGTHYFNIYDASNNCVSKTYNVNLNSSNCGEVSGTVFLDNNTDCNNNSGDLALSNQQIVLAPSGSVTYTGSNGSYSINNVAFGAYTLLQHQSWYNQASSCGNYFPLTLLPTYDYFQQDFADTIITPSVDISTWIIASANYVPGTTNHLQLKIYNPNPFIPATGNISFTVDPNLVFVSSSSTPTSVVGNIYTWNYTNILGIQSIDVYLSTPASMMINVLLNNCLQANLTSSLDPNLSNNNFCESVFTVGSYDPNNKIVTPEGIDASHHYIDKNDSVLTYTINFQNTGTAPAIRVKLLDTLSDKLEIFKFHVLDASHPYDIRVIANHILEFTFNNIMLPDSITNEPASHGYITYQINQKGNNRYGDIIKNKASIYFDFNAPVVTNECFNTIYKKPVEVNDLEKESKLFQLSPVPADKYLNMDFNSTSNGDLIISDISGNKICTQKINNLKSYRIQTSEFKNGFYIIKFSSNKSTSTMKFVVKH